MKQELPYPNAADRDAARIFICPSASPSARICYLAEYMCCYERHYHIALAERDAALAELAKLKNQLHESMERADMYHGSALKAQAELARFTR